MDEWARRALGFAVWTDAAPVRAPDWAARALAWAGRPSAGTVPSPLRGRPAQAGIYEISCGPDSPSAGTHASPSRAADRPPRGTYEIS